MLSIEVDRFARMSQIRYQRDIERIDLPIPAKIRQLPIFSDPELASETKQRIKFVLIYINGVILLISGGLGYLLAGKTLQPIKEMVDEQNRFISDASHELRTPLTALKSSMEVHLRDRKLTLQQAKKLIRENISDVNKLKTLSDALLTLASFEKRKEVKLSGKVNLSKLVCECMEDLEPLAKERHIMFKSNLGSFSVWGDMHKLTELVTILLDNAIKYSKEDGLVSLKIRAEKGFVLFSVKDNGIGIKKDNLPLIFDRFFRAEEQRNTIGYGLGLAIAKNIVELHRGQISVESIYGKGSTFIVKLPQNKFS